MLYGISSRKIVGDGLLLVGDAAGVAYPLSGEGILTAVESGLLAAETIREAKGDFRQDSLCSYMFRVQARLGARTKRDGLPQLLGRRLLPFTARALLASRWFTRHFMLDRWFLHASDQRLRVPIPVE